MDKKDAGVMINLTFKQKSKITQISFYFLITILISSCATQKRCTKKFPNVATMDSVYIEKLKEVKVLLPGDTVTTIVQIDCPDQEVSITENNKLKQEISILNKKLRSKIIIKPDTVVQFVTETKEVIKEVKVPEIRKETPKFWKITGWIGIVSILICLLYFALKLGLIKKLF